MAAHDENILSRITDEGLTYDDVLIIPRRADIVPSEVVTETRLTRNVRMNIPLVSAAMDTVTEARLSIALAQEGGVGIIHKNLALEAQVREVATVKRSANGVIRDPVTLSPAATAGAAKALMRKHRISGLPVVDDNSVVVGILTSRDLRFQTRSDTRVDDLMTRDVVTASSSTTLEQARDILHDHKVEKLVLVDAGRRLSGLITIKDIGLIEEYPHACRDERGRLRVGAAVGVFDYERTEALIAADCDVIVVDTAHGHSKNVLETVREIKRRWDIEVVAGNVATGEGTRDLIEAGADAVKVGIGPGSICTTRVVAGVGVPQLTAVMRCYDVAKNAGVPIVADGGVRQSGDAAKALAAGASSVMIGSLFAGLEESPGELIHYQGRTFKAVRGMGSLGAMVKGSKDRYSQGDIEERDKLVPEGVEGMVPYKARLSDYVYQFVGGLRSSMGYCGVSTIEEFAREARFVRVTPAALNESHPHDIMITKEAPNYRGKDV
ncbi:MAG: IMP dehydrogenase [Planctomycetota bacterium]|nr:IMP dehydrogenase [Planctomycetota bacterium]